MRIPIKSSAQAPWYLRPFFWNQRRKYGAALDSALLWARSPPLFDERERAALEYAEAVLYPDRGVDDALIAEEEVR